MIIPPEIIATKNLPPDDAKILDDFESEGKIICRQKSSFIDEIQVVENRLGRFIKFNDTYQSGKINHPLYKGNIPYVNYFFLAAAMKNEIKNVLVLGLGSGCFVNQLKSILPQVNKIDVIEINPELTKIAEDYFGFQKHGINIKTQDGRVFVRNCTEKYDLIILDVFSDAGMSYRFMTKEFFREVNNILSQGGILASNTFGLTDINAANNSVFKSIYNTYDLVFNDNMIFPTNYGNFEFYNQLIGLNHTITDLTNVIIFSSNEELCIKTSKVLQIEDKLGIELDKYVQDFYTGDINFEKATILLDEYENHLEFDFLKK